MPEWATPAPEPRHFPRPQVPREVETVSQKSAKDGRNKRCKSSAVHSKQVQAMLEALTVAGSAQRQSTPVVETGVTMAAKERSHKVHNSTKKTSSHQLGKSRVQTKVELQSAAAATREHWNRSKSPFGDAELSHTSSVQLTSSQRRERSRSGEVTSTRSKSITLHRQISVTFQRRTADDDAAAAAATSGRDFSKQKSTTRIDRQGALLREGGGSPSASKSFKRDMVLHPYLQTQNALTPQYVGSRCSDRQRVQRAQQKAFAFGHSMFNLRHKDKRLEQQRKRSRGLKSYHQAAGAALEVKRPLTPRPPSQPFAAERGSGKVPLSGEGVAGRRVRAACLLPGVLPPHPPDDKHDQQRPKGKSVRHETLDGFSSSKRPVLRLPLTRTKTPEGGKRADKNVEGAHASAVSAQARPGSPVESKPPQGGAVENTSKRLNMSTAPRSRKGFKATNSSENIAEVVRAPTSSTCRTPGHRPPSRGEKRQTTDKRVTISDLNYPREPYVSHPPTTTPHYVAAAVTAAEKALSLPPVRRSRTPHLPLGGILSRQTDEVRPSGNRVGFKPGVDSCASRQGSGGGTTPSPAGGSSLQSPRTAQQGPKRSRAEEGDSKLVPHAPRGLKSSAAYGGRRGGVKTVHGDQLTPSSPLNPKAHGPKPPSKPSFQQV